MAGTLVISTLSDGTNSTSSTNCIQGSAKAWVRFNGTASPGTIAGAYNVGSVTKNNTGDYTINFTTPMTDTNYAAVGSLQLYTSAGRAWCTGPVTISTGSVRVYCGFVDATSSGLGDSTVISYAIFR